MHRMQPKVQLCFILYEYLPNIFITFVVISKEYVSIEHCFMISSVSATIIVLFRYQFGQKEHPNIRLFHPFCSLLISPFVFSRICAQMRVKWPGTSRLSISKIQQISSIKCDGVQCLDWQSIKPHR